MHRLHVERALDITDSVGRASLDDCLVLVLLECRLAAILCPLVGVRLGCRVVVTAEDADRDTVARVAAGGDAVRVTELRR